MAEPRGSGPLDVLALNSGSSSLKFGLFRVVGGRADALASGEAEGIGGEASRLVARDAAGRALASDPAPVRDQAEAMARVGALLDEADLPAPAAVGHRVVHGGPTLLRHCVIDDVVLATLEAAIAFAPLHAPAALAIIRTAREHFPAVPHTACLDTAFHADMPEVARTLPLPRDLRATGLRRYGFHGLSCASIVRGLGGDLRPRTIVAHLGSGASVTAIADGRSVDTTMGLTPTGGVVMGTRAGDLDPGVLIHLMRTRGLDAAALEDLLDHRSGLKGVSGRTSDMRALHQLAADDRDARLAIAMFAYSVRKAIAAMAAAMGGIDLLVFTGGIGEHDPETRAAICAGLSVLGVELDPGRNDAGDGRVSAPSSRVGVRVMPSEEDAEIALVTRALIEGP